MKFELNEVEVNNAKNWKAEHSKTCDLNQQAADAFFSGQVTVGTPAYYYKFYPSSIANFPYVCCQCGEEENITDYDSI